jgi:hypothetical protein
MSYVALPAVANVVRVVLTWAVGADLTAENVLHFRYSGSASGADLASGAASIGTAIFGNSAIAGAMGTHVTCESITLTDLGSMAEPHGEAVVGLPGTRTGAPLPSGAAFLVNLAIARRSRGGKGRSYMPFLTATDLDASNHFNSGGLADGTNGYLNLIESITSDSGPVGITVQCVIGYFSGYTLGPAAPGGFRKKIPTPLGAPHNDAVTSFTASARVGSQRRRNRS